MMDLSQYIEYAIELRVRHHDGMEQMYSSGTHVGKRARRDIISIREKVKGA